MSWTPRGSSCLSCLHSPVGTGKRASQGRVSDATSQWDSHAPTSLMVALREELALVGSAQAKLAVFCICKARVERTWEGQLLAPGVLAALFWPESISTSAQNRPPPLPLVLLSLAGKAGCSACSQGSAQLPHPGCPAEAVPTSLGGHPDLRLPRHCTEGLHAT